MATKEGKIKDREIIRVSLSLNPQNYKDLQLLAALCYKGNTKPTSVASTILTDFLHEVRTEELQKELDIRSGLSEKYNID